MISCKCFFDRKRSDYLVRLGDNDRNTNEGWEQDLKIKSIRSHPDYDQTQLNNDIALLELSKPAVLNKRVSLVCLPPQDYDISVNSNCYITGKTATNPLPLPATVKFEVNQLGSFSFLLCSTMWV